MCKILELCDQNPWRNNLSKLGTFDSILQRPHSALDCSQTHMDTRGVHQCMENFQSQYFEKHIAFPAVIMYPYHKNIRVCP